MPYSPQLMTLIFIKPGRRRGSAPIRLAVPKMLRKPAVMRFDVQRLGFDVRVIGATRPADTCVSTPGLCNANFARS